MSPLEIALAVALLSRVLLIALPGAAGRAWRGIVSLLAGGLLVVLLYVQGMRWQLFPLGLLATLFLLGQVLADLRRARGRRRAVALRLVSGLLVVGVAAALPLAMPIVRLPSPTGPYGVGSLAYALTDASREEIYGPTPGGPRRMAVRAWYPAEREVAEGSTGVRAPFLDEVEALSAAMATYAGLPPFVLSHLRLTSSNAWWQVPVASQEPSYPVVVFQHGWAGFGEQSSYLMEDLASHGFVVLSLEHPYSALLSVLPDGSELPLDPDTLPDGVSDAAYDAAAKRLGEQWLADARFMLSQLDADPPATLAGRLDLARLGAVGHSTGGGAAHAFCVAEPRCLAGVGLDPWFQPIAEEVLAGGSATPQLVVFSDPELAYFSAGNRERFERFAGASDGRVTALTVAGMGHAGFADAAGFTPLMPGLARLLGWQARYGPIRAARGFEIVRATTLAFLDRHLRDAPSTPAFDPTRFPEVGELTATSAGGAP